MNQLERISDCKDLDVTFVHSKGQAHHHFHRSLPITYPNPWETGIQPENLTMALCTLLEDPLDISSYGRQATQIYLQLDGREGAVMFQGGIWGNEGKRKRRFAILCYSRWRQNARLDYRHHLCFFRQSARKRKVLDLHDGQ